MGHVAETQVQAVGVGRYLLMGRQGAGGEQTRPTSGWNSRVLEALRSLAPRYRVVHVVSDST